MQQRSLSALRLLLASLAVAAAIAALVIVIDVLGAMARGVVRLNYTGEGIFLAGLSGWAAHALWRFRRRVELHNLKEQLVDGAGRLASAAGGCIAAFILIAWSPSLVPKDILSGGEVTYAVLLPVLAFAAMSGVAFAYRKNPVTLQPPHHSLRAGLYFAALGGAIAAVTLVYAGVSHIVMPYHDMALQMFGWAAGGAMVGVAALKAARMPDFNLLNVGKAYAAALLCAIGAAIPAAWLETFLWGHNLLETWNVLIFFMPFVFIGTVALGGFMTLHGWRLYRRALP